MQRDMYVESKVGAEHTEEGRVGRKRRGRDSELNQSLPEWLVKSQDLSASYS